MKSACFPLSIPQLQYQKFFIPECGEKTPDSKSGFFLPLSDQKACSYLLICRPLHTKFGSVSQFRSHFVQHKQSLVVYSSLGIAPEFRSCHGSNTCSFACLVSMDFPDPDLHRDEEENSGTRGSDVATSERPYPDHHYDRNGNLISYPCWHYGRGRMERFPGYVFCSQCTNLEESTIGKPRDVFLRRSKARRVRCICNHTNSERPTQQLESTMYVDNTSRTVRERTPQRHRPLKKRSHLDHTPATISSNDLTDSPQSPESANIPRQLFDSASLDDEDGYDDNQATVDLYESKTHISRKRYISLC